MKLNIGYGDITKFQGDAVVNAANQPMIGGTGVNGAIQKAAGPELMEHSMKIRVYEGVRCPTGHVRPTPGFNLPAAWILHTVGPVWHVGVEPDLLEGLLWDCYRRCLDLAVAMGLKSIAFPAISTGVYGCPQDTCARVALTLFREYSAANCPLEVTMVLFPTPDDPLKTWLAVREQLDAELKTSVQ